MSDSLKKHNNFPSEFDLLQSHNHYEIVTGVVDVFLVPFDKNKQGKRYFLGRWQTGELLIGLKEKHNQQNWQLIASCSTNATLNRLDWHDLASSSRLESLLNWQQHFIAYLQKHKKDYPNESLLNREISLEELPEAISNFYNAIKQQLFSTIESIRYLERHDANERRKMENNFLKRAYIQMFSILHSYNPIGKIGQNDTLTFCIQYIAQFYQEPIAEHIKIEAMDDIVQKTGMQVRQVQLNGKWWHAVTHPVLLQKMEGEGFCLALPRISRGLTLIDPIQGIQKKLTSKDAKDFLSTAWQVYSPLPQKKLKIRDLIPVAFRGCQRDLARLLVVGSIAAMLTLVTPWFTGVLFEQVVPAGNITQLQQIVYALLVAAFSAGFFELVRAITVLRIGSKLNLNLEISIWDRLIRLPVTFFRQFTTGDLTKRAMAVSNVRRIMAGVIISSLLSGIFSLFSLGLLFYYDVKLAFTAAIATLIICAYTFLISIRQLSYYKAMTTVSGELSGMTVQLLSGISKIQTTGREKTAFSLWSIKNSQIKNELYKANWYNALLSSLNALCLPLLYVIIFIQFLNRDDPLSLGIFLAFTAALGQFTAGMLGMTDAVSAIINSIPLIKRLSPILENTPEVHAGKHDPGILNGKIEVDRLRFSYSSKEELIINDVSFVINPGQYVAITGPSGSGKSTLLRLLLGFEKPIQGNIFFDDHDIKQLNVQRVREQCGVVLQNSLLISSTLFENIVGSAPLTQDDAWEAAEMAGLADDIRKMPMGMHTIISERGGTLSGGQRQRVLIARALAKKPRLLFFDEATSALDNLTQAIVIKSLEKLNTTRIVIAHRLTTIEKADLILVMDQGKIIQSGTYAQLMQQEGLFQAMSKRQLLNKS
ncbi:NHLP bacteriocin export ABC transporter permease/ATPase subunit [Legionella cardiaca]|uniref:NHLP bacteriocin export ABC transporter permease/ATPase subunit n=1 Tax=Legionella cardiaca TaxID=1071983 RepID=A0ABY8AVG0_9GAMM|nr:NHLP bacteriocin export ABC transporter permease/ATPase subunit [Legionella cardiaca]WED44429.1 NHLP bacteriocin export ABC transporter permease/ATPase subunit [Legionella cardiaca]